TRQGCAVGTDQKDCLNQIATRLSHGKCCEFAIIKRTFGHDTINGETQLFGNLVKTQRWNRAVTATAIIKQTVGIADGGFTALYSNIHELALQINNTGGTRKSCDFAVSDEHQIDTQRKQRAIFTP